MLVTYAFLLNAQPSEFDFIPNNVFGTVIAEVQIDGMAASGNDYIAAFDEYGNCAGTVKLTEYNGQTFCTLLVYGNDVTTPDEDEGIDDGETFTFRLWAEKTGVILDHPIDIKPVTEWNSGLNGFPVPGWNFADGKQIGFDSSITNVYNLADNYNNSITVFPNPIVDKANIVYTIEKYDSAVTIAVFDATGKLLVTLLENQILHAGEHRIELNANNLTSGIYYLKVFGKESNIIKKLMVTHGF